MTAFVWPGPPAPDDPLRAALRRAKRGDEGQRVRLLIEAAWLPSDRARTVEAQAAGWVERVRAAQPQSLSIDAFLHEYSLSSQEGVALMCLAEALLRIPDAATADALIRETIGGGNWDDHRGQSQSMFVNAATWALMLTGEVVTADSDTRWAAALRQLLARAGEPVVRAGVTQAMRVLGHQFVMGRTIEEALRRAADTPRIRYSYDMLGEAALTAQDAAFYFQAYADAIEALTQTTADVIAAPGISVKLSALHPRYEVAQGARARKELTRRLVELCLLAKNANIGVTVDAEEADRLDLSLDILAGVAMDQALHSWDGFGLAVQAYQKRALPLVDWLAELARDSKRRLMVRLVKGAYWDSEIKRAQEGGLDGYPVFTRKVSTDVSYLAAARKLFAAGRAFYPCFATHNAHTAAAVLEMSAGAPFEYQRLHGMGEALYAAILADVPGHAVRVYAPVGSHESLLAYLVRRLLENGANTSFVNRIVDAALPASEIAADPVAKTAALSVFAHPRIPLPRDLYGPRRLNSAGVDLSDIADLTALQRDLAAHEAPVAAAPIVGGRTKGRAARALVNPANRRESPGDVIEADGAAMREALDLAVKAQPTWDRTPATERATILRRAADAFETNRARLMALAIREAGKTIIDAVAEVREAVDYLRYYALHAEDDFSEPLKLPGPTGETNALALHGRGVFLCISPWNFPLAIFTGQVAAALAAGNAVLAKPAEQTPLIAAEAVRLLHQAGIPADILHFLPGDGPTLANAVLEDSRLAGVAFTGGTEAAQAINRRLAGRSGPLATLIAETGGQNAMIVDSSALPEQVARDAIAGAFRTAGQRCSALRVLFVQEDVADKMLTMIAGAMAELVVGDPALLSTDVGPIIDQDALKKLEAHAALMDREAKLLAKADLGGACANGTFFAPRLYEIPSLDLLTGEVFGPVLHAVRYAAKDLDRVIDAVNGTGFGLTCAIHSRIAHRSAHIAARLKVGNIYINRNQIGAVVGVQPFGGEGLSGTGPKAGGPHYLHRFALERVISTDTTAAGGNAALLAGGEL